MKTWFAVVLYYHVCFDEGSGIKTWAINRDERIHWAVQAQK